MKIAAVCVVILVCVAGAGFAADTDGADAFEKMLAGTRAGTAFAELVDAQPEARDSDEALRAAPVDKEAPGALLIVHTEDPFLGLYSFANFGFKDGKLYELVAVWSGEVEDIRGKCATFLSSVMTRHGKDYTRKCIRVFPNSKEERPVAVFYWEKDNVASLAFFLGVHTDAPLGAVGGAVMLVIISTILDQVEDLGPVREILPTHYIGAWVDAFNDPVVWQDMGRGAILSIAYAAVLLALAWRKFLRKDVLS